MKHEGLYYLAAALLVTVAWVSAPGSTQAAKSRNLNISFEGNAEHCSDLKVRSDGEVAQAAETFTLSRQEAPILEIQDSAGKSVMRVRGWDRPEYAVEVCKIASADDRNTAEALVRGISVTRSAGRFSNSGPVAENANWHLYFIVHAPRDGRLDLETKNGPMEVSGISGSLKLRATNGPIAVRDCAGQVEVHTANGPISFSGGGGEVHLNANNGPISLELAGDIWNGSQLQARTLNGPVSLTMPDTFRSGIRVETDGNSPMSCGAAACRNAWRDNASHQRTLQLNGSQDTIRVSTGNGPVAVKGSSKARRI